MFYIDPYRQNLKKILSETISRKPRPLVFGMQAHFVYLYQDGSNYSPMFENGPARGDHLFYTDSYREHILKSSCLNLEGQGLGYLAFYLI